MKIILYGDPRTKKNSARILQGRGGRHFVAPSAAFEEYQTSCLWQIRAPPEPISARNATRLTSTSMTTNLLRTAVVAGRPSI